MMDFARKQLEKYGWSDGKGLGKNEDGISQALKPKLKRSVAGIGHDAAADFTEHWWAQLYDKAAKNVEVEEKNGKTKKIKTKDCEEFEITNSTWKIKRKRNKKQNKEQYSDYFVKKAVLDNGGVKMENVDTDSEDELVDKKDALKMTDEELFAACEGRTAHKGARHGLKATGKLARIAEQEKMLLAQPKYKGYSHSNKLDEEKMSCNDLQVIEDTSLNSDADVSLTKKKKKKKKRCLSQNEQNCELAECVLPLPETRQKEDSVASEKNYECSRKIKKLKNKQNYIGNECESNSDVSMKKKCVSNDVSDLDSNMDVDEYDQEEPVKNKKSKKNKSMDL